MTPTHPLRGRAGFSLLELLATLAILVVLAGVLVPAVGSQMGRAREERALRDMNTVAKAFNAYFVDTGQWPANGAFSASTSSSEELIQLPCLYANVKDLPGWSGPYLNEGLRVNDATMWVASASREAGGLRDPWGNAYVVHYVSRQHANGSGGILLVSKGANGQVDTSTSAIRAGRSSRDDIVYVVTRAL
jgi:general secretion pathway protein G